MAEFLYRRDGDDATTSGWLQFFERGHQAADVVEPLRIVPLFERFGTIVFEIVSRQVAAL
ncbi:hypothetical protein [Roseivivax sp. THAF40]|uniref:hypothetical protein n=1 Tax=Roseivivax sp. THAF40 TaxID=2587858 RepID=UPI001268BBC6|nr:hypothetical protein [Roseivivax sp. THAF40]